MTVQLSITPDSARRITLRTLGEAALYSDTASAALLGPGKPLALLIYLALTPGRRTSREFLLDLLWADLDPDRARSALRQTLFHLRRLLGEDQLIGTEELTLVGSLEVDRDHFLTELEGQDLESAVALYSGNFLPNFGVPGGASFEHWADLERLRLQTAFLRAADILVRRQLNLSRFKDGGRLARRVRDLLPHEEAAWRLVLECAITERDFVAATVEAEALERWAAEEGATLETATRTTLSRARGLTPGREEEVVGNTLIAEMTGREREFFAITSAWEAIRTGRVKHLHITAPPGFGKSRLLQEACARLAATGAHVARVNGMPGDREVPFAFAGDCANALAALPGALGVAPGSAATLVALNPTLSNRYSAAHDATQGEEALRRRIHALVDLAHSISHEQPFVLAIDDLHWIDRHSYRVLEGLFSRLQDPHILCLSTSRPERYPVGDAFLPLPLPALTVEQLSDLVSALGSLPERSEWAHNFMTGLHRSTGGSPLLVLETLRVAIDDGALTRDENEWRCLDEVRLRELLQSGAALRERLRGLPMEQAALLTLLSTAGTALDHESLASASGQQRAEVASLLARMEHQGLVLKTDAGWTPVHDEIAAAVRADLSTEQQRAADSAIATHYERRAEQDGDNVLRAARHFLAAGEQASVERLFRKFALHARARGDRRHFADLASELTGENATSALVTKLARSLPLRWKVGLWSTRREVAAAAILLLVPTIGAGVLYARRGADESLQRLMYADSSDVTSAVLMRPSEWNNSSDPLLPTVRASNLAGAAKGYPTDPPAISPDGRSAAWIQDSGDSTTLDIWIRTPSGTRRLTTQPRDDLVFQWLPDGSALLGATNRWSPAPPNGTYNLAVFDTANGSARPVTLGAGYDVHPRFSPDGSRIAFTRVLGDRPPLVCVTTISGTSEPVCRMVDGQPLAQLYGWTSLDELLLTTNATGGRPLVVYNWQRDVATVLQSYAYHGMISPDRKWIVATVSLPGVSGARDVIASTVDPTRTRIVGLPGRVDAVVRWWEGKPDQSLLIARLEFTDSIHAVFPGVATRFQVRAVTAAGVEVPLRVPVEWTSSDTLRAIVDSTGEMRVRSVGEVVINASLGGWRKVSKTIQIGGRAPQTILQEPWDSTWESRWLPWGNPRPMTVTGPQKVNAFWGRGDGTYPSMAVLRQALRAEHGLGLEIQLSTPITSLGHQRLKAMLARGVDLRALETGDQDKSPASTGEEEAKCGIIFPGEGAWAAKQASVFGGISVSADLKDIASHLRSGAWWTLRLQLLPDGRCGIAINGRVVWLSPSTMPVDGDYRVWLGDEAFGSKLLHGPLQIWTGVRTDIDWSNTVKR